MTSILAMQPPLDYYPQDACLSSIAIAAGIGTCVNANILNRFNEANDQGMVDFWLELVDFGILSARLCHAIADTTELTVVWAYEIDEQFGSLYRNRILALDGLGELDNPGTDLVAHGLDTVSLQALLGKTVYEALVSDNDPNRAAIAEIIKRLTGFTVPDNPPDRGTDHIYQLGTKVGATVCWYDVSEKRYAHYAQGRHGPHRLHRIIEVKS